MSNNLHEFWKSRVVFWEDVQHNELFGHVVGFGQTHDRQVMVKIQMTDAHIPGSYLQEITRPIYVRPESIYFKSKS